MLVIRDAQLDVLAEATLARSIAEHLRQYFPERCADLDGGVGAFVREGINRARRHGLANPAHLCQYVDLMMVFGRAFDEDPQLPWAGRILRDPALEHPGTKMLQLCREAERWSGGGVA